jgi:hypothetical protein
MATRPARSAVPATCPITVKTGCVRHAVSGEKRADGVESTGDWGRRHRHCPGVVHLGHRDTHRGLRRPVQLNRTLPRLGERRAKVMGAGLIVGLIFPEGPPACWIPMPDRGVGGADRRSRKPAQREDVARRQLGAQLDLGGQRTEGHDGHHALPAGHRPDDREPVHGIRPPPDSRKMPPTDHRATAAASLLAATDMRPPGWITCFPGGPERMLGSASAGGTRRTSIIARHVPESGSGVGRFRRRRPSWRRRRPLPPPWRPRRWSRLLPADLR